MNKRYIILFLCLLAVLLPLHILTTYFQGQELRIMCYNIRNGRGLDNVTDLQRTADVILKQQPDVVAIQEIDSVTNRSKQVDVLQVLAEKTQMYHTYAPAIAFDGGKYGIGMLSKEKPMSFYYLPLPGREEQRALLVVNFKTYIYCCTHFSLTEEDRLASLDIIRMVAEKSDKPFFIAGDLNAKPDSEVIVSLQKDFRLLTNPEQHTFPADTPNVTIDYIATYLNNQVDIAVKSAWVVDEPVISDHRPIVTDIIFK